MRGAEGKLQAGTLQRPDWILVFGASLVFGSWCLMFQYGTGIGSIPASRRRAKVFMSVLTISARAMGKRKPLVPDWQVPWPPDEHDSGEPLTLRQLITRIVVEQVKAFKERQERGKLVRILTERQIEEGLGKGRVDSGGRELHQTLNPEEAVATALQAFEDGLYLVILDGEEQRELDRQIFLQADSHLVFVRLVMLAGG